MRYPVKWHLCQYKSNPLEIVLTLSLSLFLLPQHDYTTGYRRQIKSVPQFRWSATLCQRLPLVEFTLVLPRFRFEPRWPRVDPWPEPLWPEPAVRVRWGSDVVQVGGQQFFEKAWPALTRFDPDPNLEPLQPECQHGRWIIELIFCTCSGSSSRNPCLGSFWLVCFDYTSPIH